MTNRYSICLGTAGWVYGTVQTQGKHGYATKGTHCWPIWSFRERLAAWRRILCLLMWSTYAQ